MERTLFRVVLLVGAAALASSLTVSQAAAAPAGLVAAYGFNEGAGTSVADASGLGNGGSTSSTTWAALGRYGGALSFNGTSGSVTVPDAPRSISRPAMTLEAWVNPSALGSPATSWRTAVLKETTAGMAYALYANNGTARPTRTGRTSAASTNAAGTRALR